jgi:hypothetical protein
MLLKLTRMYEPAIEAQAARTHAGMAFWAGSGPDGPRCRDCKFFGYETPRRNRSGDVVGTARRPGCAMFFQLMRKHGPAFPGNTLACKYHEART